MASPAPDSADRKYRCPICKSMFDTSSRLLAHKKKTGHAAERCLVCQVWLPSKSAHKKHQKVTGHASFEGIIVANKTCRTLGEDEEALETAEQEREATINANADDTVSVSHAGDDGTMSMLSYNLSDSWRAAMAHHAPSETNPYALVYAHDDDDGGMEVADGDEIANAENERKEELLSRFFEESEREGFNDVRSEWEDKKLRALNDPIAPADYPPAPYTQDDYFYPWPPPPEGWISREDREKMDEAQKEEAERQAKERVKRQAEALAKKQAAEKAAMARRAAAEQQAANNARPKPVPKDKKKTGGKVDKNREYTPFGKAVGSIEEVTFDLEYSFTFIARQEKNLKFYELIMKEEQKFPPPSDWLLEKLTEEWGGTEHWEYVQQPVPMSSSQRELEEGDSRDFGHEGMTPDSFLHLPESAQAGLCMAEILALRLYTGPGYKEVNQNARLGGVENAYPVTCYVLEAAIIKLGQFARKQDVIRGLRGNMPAKFQQLYAEGKKLKTGDVIADPGFVSATKDTTVATGSYGGNVLFIIRGKSGRPGTLRTGVDVSWISQFPKEQEVLFSQYTELWYVLPEKRDKTAQFAHLKKTVYEFNPILHYNEKHKCPSIPGLG